VVDEQMYTIILADGDIVGTDEANTNQTRHWLINGASLSGAVPYAVNYTGATTMFVDLLIDSRPKCRLFMLVSIVTS
jgi:hypothetical protein